MIDNVKDAIKLVREYKEKCNELMAENRMLKLYLRNAMTLIDELSCVNADCKLCLSKNVGDCQTHGFVWRDAEAIKKVIGNERNFI